MLYLFSLFSAREQGKPNIRNTGRDAYEPMEKKRHKRDPIEKIKFNV